MQVEVNDHYTDEDGITHSRPLLVELDPEPKHKLVFIDGRDNDRDLTVRTTDRATLQGIADQRNDWIDQHGLEGAGMWRVFPVDQDCSPNA